MISHAPLTGGVWVPGLRAHQGLRKAIARNRPLMRPPTPPQMTPAGHRSRARGVGSIPPLPGYQMRP